MTTQRQPAYLQFDPADLYLSYLNDFLTVDAWAEYYEIDPARQGHVLMAAKAHHEAGVEQW